MVLILINVGRFLEKIVGYCPEAHFVSRKVPLKISSSTEQKLFTACMSFCSRWALNYQNSMSHLNYIRASRTDYDVHVTLEIVQ